MKPAVGALIFSRAEWTEPIGGCRLGVYGGYQR
jgi:hypothetical protein